MKTEVKMPEHRAELRSLYGVIRLPDSLFPRLGDVTRWVMIDPAIEVSGFREVSGGRIKLLVQPGLKRSASGLG
jgi:hypothetical protein